MKIQLTLSKTNTPDKITASGNIITINGTDYDITDIKERIVSEDGTPDDSQIYKEADGTEVMILKCDTFRFDLANLTRFEYMEDGKLIKALSSNLIVWHDLNNDGSISWDEVINSFIPVWNQDEETVRADRMKARNEFFSNTVGTEKEKKIEWLKRGLVK